MIMSGSGNLPMDDSMEEETNLLDLIMNDKDKDI